MVEESVDPPPSYAEAMVGAQLSPTQLTQVIQDHQCNRIQINSARLPNDRDDASAKEIREKKSNKIVCEILQLALLIFVIGVFLYFLFLY